MAAYTTRREAFLDAAQQLVQRKGYEQMSIQDVLDEMGVSRGAFYHYFNSKAALLEAVIERMVTDALAAVGPIVDDPMLSAQAKLRLLFSGIARWKTDRKALMLEILRVWYSDDNALMREKLRQAMLTQLVPLLSAIITQGRGEGIFSAGSPDTARVLVTLVQGAQDLAGELFSARQANEIAFVQVEQRFLAYQEAVERILGVPAGSITFVDPPTLQEWFG